MAMPVEQCAARYRRRYKALGLADQKFVEQQRVLRERSRTRIVRQQPRQLVAKGEDAARLQTDHADFAFDEWREHVENPHQAALGEIEHSLVIEWTAATQVGRRDDHAKACPLEHFDRRDRDFGLKKIVERVGKQKDFWAAWIVASTAYEPRTKRALRQARQLALA